MVSRSCPSPPILDYILGNTYSKVNLFFPKEAKYSNFDKNLNLTNDDTIHLFKLVLEFRTDVKSN
jgi:hypothetical protein